MMPGGPCLGFHEARRASEAMRRLRAEQNLSIADLAARLGTSENWVSMREGCAVRLRQDDAVLVAAALGTDLAGLTGGGS